MDAYYPLRRLFSYGSGQSNPCQGQHRDCRTTESPSRHQPGPSRAAFELMGQVLLRNIYHEAVANQLAAQ